MTTHFTREHIMEGLILDVAECMAIEPADIQPEVPIFEPGDSLEALDITFRIQKRFGIRIQLHSLLEGWTVESDGTLSSNVVQKLNAEFPRIDWGSRLASIQHETPFEVFTVGLLTEMVFSLQKPDPPRSPESNTETISTTVSN